MSGSNLEVRFQMGENLQQSSGPHEFDILESVLTQLVEERPDWLLRARDLGREPIAGEARAETIS